MAVATGNEFMVLGIDPGSRHMGWAVVAGTSHSARRIDSGSFDIDGRTPLPQRLGQLLRALEALLDRHTCTQLAIEAAFVHENARTALVLGQARGLPIALAAARGLSVHEYPPATVKRTIVGSGRAEKAQVRQMTKILLNLAELPGEDEADALAVALTHLRSPAHLAGVVQPAAFAAIPAASTAPTAAQAVWLAHLAAARSGGRRS